MLRLGDDVTNSRAKPRHVLVLDSTLLLLYCHIFFVFYFVSVSLHDFATLQTSRLFGYMLVVNPLRKQSEKSRK